MPSSRRNIFRAGLAAASMLAGANPLAAGSSNRRVLLTMPKLICRAKTEGSEDEIYLILAGRTSQGNGIAGRMPQDHWDLDEKKPSKAEVTDIKLWEGSLPNGSTVDLTLFVLEADESPTEHAANLGRVVADQTTAGGSPIGVKADVERLLSQAFPHTGNPTIEVKRQEGNMEIFGMPTNIPRRSVSVGISFYNTDDCPGVIGIRLAVDGRGNLNADYAARARCQDRGWVEAKVAPELFAPFSLLLPREIVSRLEQQELAMLRTLAQRPTRQFWCTGDGAFYRVFLRAEVA